jgi:hypothetical protein
LAYQSLASSTFLSQQTSHQQSASSTFLSKQISTSSHQSPAKRTCCKFVELMESPNHMNFGKVDIAAGFMVPPLGD